MRVSHCPKCDVRLDPYTNLVAKQLKRGTNRKGHYLCKCPQCHTGYSVHGPYIHELEIIQET